MKTATLLRWIRLLGDVEPSEVVWLVGDLDHARGLLSGLSQHGLIERCWVNGKTKVWRAR